MVSTNGGSLTIKLTDQGLTNSSIEQLQPLQLPLQRGDPLSSSRSTRRQGTVRAHETFASENTVKSMVKFMIV